MRDLTEHLVTMRCLTLLFYNFRFKEDIEPLIKQSHPIAHAWEKLEYKCKQEKYGYIPDFEFYSFFADLSYDSQSKFIEVALDRYETEARKSIEFSAFATSFFETKGNELKD